MKSDSKKPSSSSPFKLFREPFDTYNLAVPVFLLVGIFVEIFFLRGALNAYTNHIQFFQDFVFFSQLHPSMTYVLLISTATGQKITRDFVTTANNGILKIAVKRDANDTLTVVRQTTLATKKFANIMGHSTLIEIG